MKPRLVLHRWDPAYFYGFVASCLAVILGALGVALIPHAPGENSTTFWTLALFLTILGGVGFLGCCIPVSDAARNGSRIELGERVTLRFPLGSKSWLWDDVGAVEMHRSYYQDTICTPTGIVPIPGVASLWFYDEKTITKSAKALGIFTKGGDVMVTLVPTAQQDLAFNRWMGQKAAADIVQGLGGSVIWLPTREKFAKRPRWIGTSVQEVSLAGTSIDDQQFSELLRYLAQCDELRKLDLSNTPLTDAALKEFHLIRRVPEVAKQGSRISDDALSAAVARLRENPDNNRFAFIGKK